MIWLKASGWDINTVWLRERILKQEILMIQTVYHSQEFWLVQILTNHTLKFLTPKQECSNSTTSMIKMVPSISLWNTLRKTPIWDSPEHISWQICPRITWKICSFRKMKNTELLIAKEKSTNKILKLSSTFTRVWLDVIKNVLKTTWKEPPPLLKSKTEPLLQPSKLSCHQDAKTSMASWKTVKIVSSWTFTILTLMANQQPKMKNATKTEWSWLESKSKTSWVRLKKTTTLEVFFMLKVSLLLRIIKFIST